MQKLLFLLCSLITGNFAFSQVNNPAADYSFKGSANFGKGAAAYTPTQASAIAEFGAVGTIKGIILPRVYDNANVVTPTEGMQVYNMTVHKTYIYTTGSWQELSLGANYWARSGSNLSPATTSDVIFVTNGMYFNAGNLDMSGHSINNGNTIGATLEIVSSGFLTGATLRIGGVGSSKMLKTVTASGGYWTVGGATPNVDYLDPANPSGYFVKNITVVNTSANATLTANTSTGNVILTTAVSLTPVYSSVTTTGKVNIGTVSPSTSTSFAVFSGTEIAKKSFVAGVDYALPGASTITLTTTGSSGASTYISNVLNVPNYTLSGLGGIPISGGANIGLGTSSQYGIYAQLGGNFYERLRIGQSDGTVRVSSIDFYGTDVGGALINASGKSIDSAGNALLKFIRATSVATDTVKSSNVGTNPLVFAGSNYAKANFTATLTATTSGTITLDNNSMQYTRKDDVVYFSGQVNVSSVSSPLGALNLNGLPISAGSGTKFYSSVTIRASGLNAGTYTSLQGFVIENSNIVRIEGFSSAGASIQLAPSVIANTNLIISGFYIVN